MKSGHIRITDKVYFEYYELENTKPLPYMNGWVFSKSKYNKALKAYEASKQLVEVENVYWWDESKVWTYTSRYYKEFDAKEVINNQTCRAEIKDNKATIIELIN